MNKRLSKILIIVLLIVATLTGNNITVSAKEVPFTTSAHAYIVIDANTGKTLYEQNADKKVYPASTVKLMTAIVTTEQGYNDKKFVIKKNVLQQVDTSAYRLKLKPGSKYTFDNLLNMMLISSDADSSYTIAANSKGDIEPFIKLMNKKARELGLKNTSFDNPIGLDIGNYFNNTYSTAREMSVIARYAMSIDNIRKVVAKETYHVPILGIDIKNTNRFYKNSYNDQLFTVNGCKTGTTNAAGSVLIASAIDKDGHEVICAYFGKVSHQDTFNKINKIFTHVFEQNKKGNLTLNKGFLDMRFKDNELLVNHYLDLGILKQSSNKKFNPENIVSEKEFLKTVKSISGVSLKGKNKTKITFKDFDKMFFTAYPLAKEVQAVTGSAITINTKARKTYLYDIGVFAKNYPYIAKKEITKLDMILISDNLKAAVKKKNIKLNK